MPSRARSTWCECHMKCCCLRGWSEAVTVFGDNLDLPRWGAFRLGRHHAEPRDNGLQQLQQRLWHGVPKSTLSLYVFVCTGRFCQNSDGLTMLFQSKRLPSISQSISQRIGIHSAPFFGTSHCVARHCLVHRSTGHGYQHTWGENRWNRTTDLIVDTVDTPGTAGRWDFVVLQKVLHVLQLKYIDPWAPTTCSIAGRYSVVYIAELWVPIQVSNLLYWILNVQYGTIYLEALGR